jgi:hypothetical protein
MSDAKTAAYAPGWDPETGGAGDFDPVLAQVLTQLSEPTDRWALVLTMHVRLMQPFVVLWGRAVAHCVTCTYYCALCSTSIYTAVL